MNKFELLIVLCCCGAFFGKLSENLDFPYPIMEHTQLIILMLANFQIILSGVLEQRHIKSKVAIIVAGEVLYMGNLYRSEFSWNSRQYLHKGSVRNQPCDDCKRGTGNIADN